MQFIAAKNFCGSRKLAMWEAPSPGGNRELAANIGKGVRIETRGEGGYVVAEGSPCSTHASGVPYVQAFGPRLPNLQHVSPQERRQMWLAAMEFDCIINRESAALKRARQEAKRQMYGPIIRNESEPWTWFDMYGDWFDMLERHNWTTTNGALWARPGKDFGVSASICINREGEEVLVVFSTDPACGPLAATGSASQSKWGKFNTLVALDFGGDRKAAVKHVRQLMGISNGH